jgi:hypothetical protein
MLNEQYFSCIMGRTSYFSEMIGSFGQDLKKSANQKQELPVVAMFGNGS